MRYFPFSYTPECSIKTLEATEKFFDANIHIQERITALTWAYQSIGKAIPHTTDNLFSGHFFPYVESFHELQISCNLALLGFYKQAFTSLRSLLELGMLSVYYNINDEGHIVVKEWLHSKDTWEANTPKTDKIWKILRSNQNIAGFDDKLLLRDRFNALSYLHNYVHTKGFKFSNELGRTKSNFQTFEEHALLKWISAFEEIILILVTLHMLKYPISIIKFDWSEKVGIDNPFPVLEEFEIERIEELLPENYIQEITSIAQEDAFTQGLFEQIKSLPDMTETEQKDQILDHDKMMIENGQGFLEWKKFQLSISKDWSPEGRAELKSRIEILHQWALENNMMKPKIERLEGEGFFEKPPHQE